MTPSGGYVVTGTVDGAPVRATLERGELDLPAELRRRAQLVVDLGDTFDAGNGTLLEASLDGDPLIALLTAMRAFDRILSIEVQTGERSMERDAC